MRMKLVPVTIEVIGKSEQILFKKQIQMEAFTEEATGNFVVSHEAICFTAARRPDRRRDRGHHRRR